MHHILNRSSGSSFNFQFSVITMNSLELAYQMRRISINSSSSAFSPPEMLPTSMMSFSIDTAQEFEFDSSQFDSISSTPSYVSSFYSLSPVDHATGQGLNSGLSRSRCAQDLSMLSSSPSAGNTCSTRQIPSLESGPKAGWGYFVDTPPR